MIFIFFQYTVHTTYTQCKLLQQPSHYTYATLVLGRLSTLPVSVNDACVSSPAPPQTPSSVKTRPDTGTRIGRGRGDVTEGQTQDEKRCWTAANERNGSMSNTNEEINYCVNFYETRNQFKSDQAQ